MVITVIGTGEPVPPTIVDPPDQEIILPPGEPFIFPIVISGTVGQFYSYDVTVTVDEEDTFTFALLEGPDWLSIGNQGDGGLLFGIPTEAGSYEITIQVTNNHGLTDTQTFTIIVIVGEG